MESKLEFKIEARNEEEYESLYPSYICEIDDAGEELEKFIPWHYSTFFVVKSIQYVSHIGLERDFSEENTEDEDSSLEKHPYSEALIGTLEHDPRFSSSRLSMFGTKREIRDISVRIYAGEKEHAEISGSVAFIDKDLEFLPAEAPDSLTLEITITAGNFQKLKKHVLGQPNATINMSLGDVDGFYAPWTPSIFADEIKVLTEGHDFSVPKEVRGYFPLLGKLSEFDISVSSHHELETTSFHRNSSKFFGDDGDDDDPSLKPEDMAELNYNELVQISASLKKITKTQSSIFYGVIALLVLSVFSFVF